LAYNSLTGRLLSKIRPLLPDRPTVVELGSQSLTFEVGGHPDIDTVPALYAHLGFARYEAVDFNGEGTILGDLNQRFPLDDRFDLVTNIGTGEHVFNQAAVFGNCHDWCRPGGLMLHTLPWLNWLNHGFFSFQPSLFLDLAKDNGYEVVTLFAADRDGNHQRDVSTHEVMPADATGLNLLIVAVLRRSGEAAFIFPTQTQYRDSRAEDM